MAQDAPLVLQPGSDWQIDYGEDICSLARTFGEGDDRVALIFARADPGDMFRMTVAGKPLQNHVSGRPVVSFTPDGTVREVSGQAGVLGNFGPALFQSGMTLLPVAGVEAQFGKSARFDRTRYLERTDILSHDLDSGDEGRIVRLEISGQRLRTVTLVLGSMRDPMKALRACVSELVTHWGIDVAAHRKLSRGVAPVRDPSTWIGPDDYPSDLLSMDAQGFVGFRLMVGKDGKPTSCHVQSSTNQADFDAISCRLLMRRARFTPALDSEGNPIESYWASSVIFSILR